MKIIFLTILFLPITATVLSQGLVNGLGFSVTYEGEIAGNVRGGIKRGITYLGKATAGIVFETGNAGLWNGGSFCARMVNTHGGTPSESLLGDFQVASNIEAGPHTYLHELWYRQSFKKLNFIIGLQDLNVLFAVSENGSFFLNSSFGVPSVLSDNIPAPIFPLTSLGVTTTWDFSENLSWKVAAYDGCPEVFEKNPYNLHWDINKNDGLLIFNEFQFKGSINKMTGIYKAGGYYHTGLNEVRPDTSGVISIFPHNYGAYFLADQTIWERNENSRLSFFSQVSLSPETINSQNLYIGAGVTYSDVFMKNGSDLIGLGVASAFFRNRLIKHETSVELTYNMSLGKYFYLQPDIQYIIHPTGTKERLANALVTFFRFGVNIESER